MRIKYRDNPNTRTQTMTDTMPTVEGVIADALTKLSVWTEHDLRVKAIATALREAGMVDEWEDIETAPKNATKVLTYTPPEGV
jgi:hypothetical protein